MDGRSGLLRAFPRLVTFPPGTVSHGSPRVVVAPEILGGFSSGQQLAWSVAGSWGTEGLQAVMYCTQVFIFHLDCMFTAGVLGGMLKPPQMTFKSSNPALERTLAEVGRRKNRGAGWYS